MGISSSAAYSMYAAGGSNTKRMNYKPFAALTPHEQFACLNDIKRLPEGCGLCNAFGLNCCTESSIAEL